MIRIAFALVVILSASSGWAAEKLSLAAISDYFNGIETAKSPFSQINDDGTVSTGMLYIHRPGRMRFEYDPPAGSVVIAGGGAVTILDPKSNQPAETYPLKRTPLWIILARKVDLDQAKMVVGHGFDGTVTLVRAQDPQYPEYGSIDLVFTDNPIELRKWVINDGNGGQTTVTLDGLQTGGRLNSLLFTTQTGSGTSDR